MADRHPEERLSTAVPPKIYPPSMNFPPIFERRKGLRYARAAVRGFTLAELLVSIAVVGILAALLFPMTSKVFDRSKEAKCAAQLRQIAVQAGLWSVENNGWVPPARWLTDFSVDQGGVNKRLRQCPSLPPLPPPLPGQPDIATSYGINNRLVTGSGAPGDPMWGPNYQYYNERGRYLMAVLSPKNTILFADTVNPSNLKVGYYMAMNQWFDCRHEGRANVVFVDGHIEQKDAKELSQLAPWTQGIPDQQK